jgi:hypothetical protein
MRLIVFLVLLALGLAGCTLALGSVGGPVEDRPPEITAVPFFSTPGAVTESPFSDAVQDRIRAIYLSGQAMGNRADVFSKVGDSITVSRYFLAPVGEGVYDLREYGHLQSIVAYFSRTAARSGNSFVNVSLAAGEGWAAWGALDAALAGGPPCLPLEAPLACEYRVVRPAFAVIMFGTNDVGYRTPAQFRADLTRVVEISTAAGVVPILSTFPPRPELLSRTATFNLIVAEVGQRHDLPVIDLYDVLVSTPAYGLAWDQLHLSSPGYETAADFHPENLGYGYVVRNLLTLQALDAVVRVALSPSTE